MGVKATFEVMAATDAGAGLKSVVLYPVFGGEGGAPLGVAPSSQISVGIVSAEDAAQFEVGKQFVVEFTPA